MSTVTVYSSADASAPVLTGQVGTLIAVLDACLVNGYGSKAAAGWTIAFTATNKRIYKSGNDLNCPSVVMITDDGSAASGSSSKGFGAFGGTAASDLGYSYLTDPFPTSAQRANGMYGLKANGTDATPRDWLVIADDRTFYLFVSTATTGANGWSAFHFGEMYSYKQASGVQDLNRLIMGGSVNVNLTYYSSSLPTGSPGAYGTKPTVPEYMPNSYSGVGGALPVGKCVDASKGNLAISANTLYVAGSLTNPLASLTYPHPVDGGLYMSPVCIFESAGVIRGHLRGVWAPLHVQPLSHGDTFSGTGQLAGKSFLAVNASGGSGGTLYVGQLMIEISSTWDTN
jgi:hypothetical protein